ncbi:ABC transporter ATP-binding protein [Spirochaetia bacterium 38H-sp]|uniref:ABC transporter ATP-binding protein n=1 Tax=Rarispira pelagica TaxID=3141764 RepID=A0ABU9UA95_9SPIR
MKKIIQVKHCYKSYGKLKALTDLSFSAEEGQCVALLGPNGAGKTTMIKILYGKAIRDKHPDTQISVLGYDPEKDEIKIKEQSGVVQQDDNLDDELNVEQNLALFARLYRMQKEEAKKRIEELLEFMELTEKRKEAVKALSGGMKRRLVIARALLNKPRLLFLDEPTTGLDPQVRQLIWDRVRSLKKEGMTVLLTTHYMDEAYHMADNIIIMDKGRALLEGNPRELTRTQIEPHVLEVMESTDNIPDIEGIRKDKAEGRTLLYAQNEAALKKAEGILPPGSYYQRPTSLEDLFLKVTGRRLKDGQ